MTSTIRSHYADTHAGQVHLRRINAGNAEAPPLVCLHPAPYSSLYFTTLMPLLGRDVIAPDYPGYGGSARPDAQPAIGDYASAMLECLDSIGLEGPVDLFGFHSGCLVAAEMSIEAPARFNHVVLCDIPYFDSDMQAQLVEKVAHQIDLTVELESLERSWDLAVRRRADVMGLERAFELYVEQLRAVPHDHEAFVAAFSYDCENRFRQVQRPVTVIATGATLREPTIEAAGVIPNATLVDAEDVTMPVFEKETERMAEFIIDALDARAEQ